MGQKRGWIIDDVFTRFSVKTVKISTVGGPFKDTPSLGEAASPLCHIINPWLDEGFSEEGV